MVRIKISFNVGKGMGLQKGGKQKGFQSISLIREGMVLKKL